MMDTFADALISGPSEKIPKDCDWFAPLIGDWECDYWDEPEPGHKRHVKGEWIFRRILEGTGIQDVFIFPSRDTKETEPQPDGEYGTSLRMFNRENRCYDVVYTCERCMKRLTFTRDRDRLVGRVLDEKNAFWIFSDLTGNRFHWENIRISENGERELVCEISGRRAGQPRD